MKTYLGIDFSGNQLMWRKGCKKSNIWIAVIQLKGKQRRLVSLKPVQNLPEQYGEHPFERLVNFLKQKQFEAAGIDAPFSLPRKFIRAFSYHKFLEQIDQIPCEGFPFPRGSSFARQILGKHQSGKSEDFLRKTEKLWRARGISLRPTLWTGVRAGAPFTSACLKLLARRGGPIWPWSKSDQKGLLVEAFPMAQLVQWGAYQRGYSQPGPLQDQLRERIVQFLAKELKIPRAQKELMAKNPDALDAVICAFAGIAVSEHQLAIPPEKRYALWEGWIAVHR